MPGINVFDSNCEIVNSFSTIKSCADHFEVDPLIIESCLKNKIKFETYFITDNQTINPLFFIEGEMFYVFDVNYKLIKCCQSLYKTYRFLKTTSDVILGGLSLGWMNKREFKFHISHYPDLVTVDGVLKKVRSVDYDIFEAFRNLFNYKEKHRIFKRNLKEGRVSKFEYLLLDNVDNEKEVITETLEHYREVRSILKRKKVHSELRFKEYLSTKTNAKKYYAKRKFLAVFNGVALKRTENNKALNPVSDDLLEFYNYRIARTKFKKELTETDRFVKKPKHMRVLKFNSVTHIVKWQCNTCFNIWEENIIERLKNTKCVRCSDGKPRRHLSKIHRFRHIFI